MDARISEALDRITVDACEGLLESLGVEAHHLSTKNARSVGSNERIAVIGFGGESLRGSLVLDVPPSILTRTHPSQSETDGDLEDWIGELSNLVLGRFKSKLLPFDVVIQLSTPIVVRGKGTSIELSTGHSVVHTFSAEGATFDVLLAADAEGELVLDGEPTREIESVEDMVFF